MISHNAGRLSQCISCNAYEAGRRFIGCNKEFLVSHELFSFYGLRKSIKGVDTDLIQIFDSLMKAQRYVKSCIFSSAMYFRTYLSHHTCSLLVR